MTKESSSYVSQLRGTCHFHVKLIRVNHHFLRSFYKFK